MSNDANYGRFGSGHAVRRIEDPALVRGAGRFADDVTLDGQTHLVFLRSPYAHAKIVSIDASAALEMPGVLAVITGADLVAAGVRPLPVSAGFPRPDGSPGASPPRHPLAHEVARFAGEAVAAIVAETRDQARDARDAVFVEYEDLPSVVDLRDATAEGAPKVWPPIPDNFAAGMRHGDAAKAEAAFAAAAHVVRLELENQRLAPSPMETRGVLASYDAATDRIDIRLSSQMPTAVRNTIADEVLGIPKEKIRVTVGDVGGGFGMKTGVYPEDAVLAWASRSLKRPV
ncbi:MAG TPA: molybdopterin cofactor-binding domain-containing protein, partial [Quisquiliibacterium sp.]|nr:molybdopterin cofactor-binding domain-containing protein [Quisquiliibacterium sp.]